MINSTQFFESILNAIGEPVFVKNDKHVWVYTNDANIRFLGLKSINDFVGHTDYDLFPKEQADLFWEIDKKVLRTGESIENEEEITDINGNTFIISTLKSLYLCPEGNRFIVGICKDITKKEKHIEALKEATDIKQLFFSKVSHEIRNSLNAILGLTNLLAENNGSESEISLSLIHSCDSLLKLANDLLELSKIDSGEFLIEYKALDIHPFLDSIHLGLSQGIKENVQFSLEKSDRVPNTIYIDKNRLTQIISNLVSNSAKFTLEGEIKLSADYFDKKLFITVSDTGIGIPEELQSNIFKEFFQIAHTEVSSIGVGLGLSMVKKIVELLKGKISYTSAVGYGTEFNVLLPVGIENIKVIDEKPVLKITDKPKIEFTMQEIKILVAEDNEMNQFLYKKIFDKNNITFDLASNGIEVLDLLNKNKYSLILMDIQMPDMDGLEATRIIRNESNQPNIPIIAVTAQIIQHQHSEFETLKLDFIEKPIDIHQLLNKIKEIING